MKTAEMILSTSDEAAQRVTMTLWRSRNGNAYVDERTARFDGCTHTPCQQCQKPTPKSWLFCDECRPAKAAERWAAMPLVEWDGTTPFCLHDSDRYFFDVDSFYDWLEDEGDDTEGNALTAADVRLVLCVPVPLRRVSEETLIDDVEDDDVDYLPKEVRAALDALNAAITNHNKTGTPCTWRAGTERIVLPVQRP